MTRVATSAGAHYQDQTKSSKPNSPHEMLAAIKRKLQDSDHAFSSDAPSLSSDFDGNLGSEDNILSRRYSVGTSSGENSSVVGKMRLLSGNGRNSISSTGFSLTDIAKAQSSSSANAKRRRRTITVASSPTNGSNRTRSFNFQSVDMAPSSSAAAASVTNPSLRQIPIHPQLKQGANASNRRNMLYQLRAMSSRMNRMPKRNLKPLDFSNIRKQKNSWKMDADSSKENTDQKKSHIQNHLVTQSSPSLSSIIDPTNIPSFSLSKGQNNDRRRPLNTLSESSDKNPIKRRRSSRALEFGNAGQENSGMPTETSNCLDSGIGTTSNLEKPSSMPKGSANEKKSTAKQAKKPTTKSSNAKLASCKYCGKQYRYRSKLKSHEQHCPSKLEALLYSQGDVPEPSNNDAQQPQEGQKVNCVCGPQHEYKNPGPASQSGQSTDLDAQDMIQCTVCSCWVHTICVSLVQVSLPSPYCCPSCAVNTPQMLLSKSHLGCSREPTMSPESKRLAVLLADVPDTSETEDEDPALRAAMIHRKRSVGKPEADSDGTMSLTDASELVRFHRQGKASTRRSRKLLSDADAPDYTRLIRSEADFAISNHPTRSRTFDNLHTDNILSSDADFFGLSLPFSLDNLDQQQQQQQQGTTSLGASHTVNNPSNLASDPPVQWPLDTLPIMDVGNPTTTSMNTLNTNAQVDQSVINGDLAMSLDMDFTALLNSTAQDNQPNVSNIYSGLIASEPGISGMLGTLPSGSNANSQDFYPNLSMGQVSYTNNVPVPRVAGRHTASNNGNMIEHGSSSTITLMNDNFSDLLMTSRVQMSDSGSIAMPKSMSQGHPSSSTGIPFNANIPSSSNPISQPPITSQAQQQQQQQPLNLQGSMANNVSIPTTSAGNADLRQIVSNAQLSQVYQDLSNGQELLDTELDGLINFDL